MPEALRFEFDAPIVDVARVGPTGQAAPFRGKTTAARHASWTGARAAVHIWAQKQSEYLQLLQVAGSLTDNEMAALAKWPLSSVCSIRNSLSELVEDDGFDTVTWESGRSTRRTRWRLKGKEVRVMGEGHEGAVEDDVKDPPTSSAQADGDSGEAPAEKEDAAASDDGA